MKPVNDTWKLNSITVRCPLCGDMAVVPRLTWDPPSATCIVLPCLDCEPDGLTNPIYYDCCGEEVKR